MTTPLKLFYATGVCSLPVHIVLHELGKPFEVIRVDLRTKKLATGGDLADVTPKSYVPALELADGSILTETAVILRYLADTNPEASLAPRHGGIDRVRFDEWLHFISTEFHKAFATFTIMDRPSEESKRWAAERLAKRVTLLADGLGARTYLFGDSFTVLDAYAFWALRMYQALTKAELPETLRAYMTRLRDRPTVRSAFAAEAA
ncbi:Glutathione S-transferase [Labilithrix luteola]|uniref:Glutathione S-transferase n=1 Tax=Labilithrix luteola TaxID=1391654 RepID=A0A0K1PK68_9BACT|nr:glutathione S-transferase N-terminal domain-containing protein [Labilithrix luteola]AKU93912.1 Glutathione S-transferase [Labilithrix luteola]